jgi:hypothetical protein
MLDRLSLLYQRYEFLRARLLLKSNWQEEAMLRFQIIDVLAEIRRMQAKGLT